LIHQLLKLAAGEWLDYSTSIGVIAVPAVPGAGVLSVSGQQSITKETIDAPRQHIQTFHHLVVPIWTGIQHMLEGIHMTGVNVNERCCAEIEVLSSACLPFVNGNIEL
jgi:hypothetical protein